MQTVHSVCLCENTQTIYWLTLVVKQAPLIIWLSNTLEILHSVREPCCLSVFQQRSAISHTSVGFIKKQ